jgi:hypothetical protein
MSVNAELFLVPLAGLVAAAFLVLALVVRRR